jgi:tetratricopeptide (TPR) repeat protein
MSAGKSSPNQQSKRADLEVPDGISLEAELAALVAQRTSDLERLRLITTERDRLRYELAERNADEARLIAREAKHENEDDDAIEKVDGWLLKPSIIRSEIRSEKPVSSILGRVAASFALRFARHAAKRRDYATAEIFYQVILLLAPRPFIWRQTGNMLAGQGLFAAAIDCFDRAIEADENDVEALHARGVALRRSGDRNLGTDVIRRALLLDPSLATRDRG